jgi:hypothetical protein
MNTIEYKKYFLFIILFFSPSIFIDNFSKRNDNINMDKKNITNSIKFPS